MEKMILFRTDGNSSVGLGHVMRCLSIADAFKKTGESCLFVTADDGMRKTIKDRGHKNLILYSKYDHMDDELESFKKAIEARDIKAVFVDSYFVTDFYLRCLWQFCAKNYITLAYIDDVLAMPYPCDILLNYNIYASLDEYQKLYEGHSKPDFLLGTSYAPLRSEFQELPDRIVSEKTNNILISTGGADFGHIGLAIVKTIAAHKEWNEINFHFIVGMMSEDKDEIRRLADGHDNIILYKKVKKMAELMQLCDVAISAAGSTLYELCSTQTPAIAYILADNQIPGANGFVEKGVLSCIGDIRHLGENELAEKALNEAIELLQNFSKRRSIAQIMKTVVDGKGADRVVSGVNEVCSMASLDQLAVFINNFNIHYSLLLKRYKRFKELDDPHNTDIDVITYLDMILVQLRSFCLEHERYHNNYTAQNLLHRLGRDDLADRINGVLEEEFFDYREGCTIRDAIKILTDDYVCHYDSFEDDTLVQSEIIEMQLRNPYINHNLDYIMKVLIECIGEGLSFDGQLG